MTHPRIFALNTCAPGHPARGTHGINSYFLCCDGPHDFAAARYIARKHRTKFIIRGKLWRSYISRSALLELTEKFDIFSTVDIDYHPWFMNEMLRFEIPFFWCPGPNKRQLANSLVFFPKRITVLER
ncbi:DUF6685 family protein [Mycoavidus sp. B2-EB]|uniref:DUF6685 family protein n=1 Tax=Mycoavidus sp. B2-EB TaxID=2651972 RepID=UPI00351C6576